jgi:holo-[acyl-carrier protein] synthase
MDADLQESGLRVGMDLVEIARIRDLIDSRGDKFLCRIYTAEELKQCNGRVESLAARFAGKEALVKALGTGLRGFRWKDVEVIREASGRPRLTLHGRAAQLANEMGYSRFEISLTHTSSIAGAVVIALRQPNET